MSEKISLAHGDGGELAHQLIQEVFVSAFEHHEHARLDAALLHVPSNKLAISTDSFVIKPVFFPGGNIGKLAIVGTVNDIAVSGAEPLYMTVGFILEEGFLIKDLKEIVTAMAEEAKKANVKIVAGDTKVVERGSVDGIFINTTGVGVIKEENFLPRKIKEGDSVIISGTIGDHGVAILSARGELGLLTDLESDCACLNRLIDDIMSASNKVKIMRDPTRGGVATTLVEICEDFKVAIEIREDDLPIKPEVEGACDLLGFEPLYLANEGKLLVIVAKEDEAKVLEVMKKHELGIDATSIGHVVEQGEGKLFLKMTLGSRRRLNRLSGIQLPRIC
ncbi:hydrogenase expression/formation protein HypE [Anaerobacillus isosaccharinicus]|uniref:Hydrogenase expression/formation protein HypE n=1 Tax=Anaerobacillus isosaccharinicus TaxID=1532552 RepID=A0A1S2LF40_9BACI|nr:hydrogenase expression/formation protein HypE [Anaerobacillus isosaccharinicus]MBA5585957.1 hydrogenase expression/formation protein HypE [Anaerobacillus isosaccharinicus]QOY35760.1 hydrogenase expression/formation protein HypE [Anaerobacillus isosaccharinicus]